MRISPETNLLRKIYEVYELYHQPVTPTTILKMTDQPWEEVIGILKNLYEQQCIRILLPDKKSQKQTFLFGGITKKGIDKAIEI